jgi:hypothetical protein
LLFWLRLLRVLFPLDRDGVLGRERAAALLERDDALAFAFGRDPVRFDGARLRCVPDDVDLLVGIRGLLFSLPAHGLPDPYGV